MADSNFNVTRLELIKGALRKVGNSNPSSTDIANATTALNIITKRIDVQGRWFFAISSVESTLAITSGVGTYTVGTGPNQIASDILALETFDLLIGNYHQPLSIFSSDVARTTLLRDGVGQPIAVYLERKASMLDNKLWLFTVPSGNYTGKYTYRRRIYDFDNVGDNPDIPQDSIECLEYQLAAHLVDDYGLPLDRCQWIQTKADYFLKLMKQANQGADPSDTATQAHYF